MGPRKEPGEVSKALRERVGFSWEDLFLQDHPRSSYRDYLQKYNQAISVLSALLQDALFHATGDNWLPKLRIEPFGSGANGFCNNESDLDVVVVADDSNWFKYRDVDDQKTVTQDFLYQLRRLITSSHKRCQFELVKHARIPVLKLFSFYGVNIDITFMNSVCLLNTRLLRSYALASPELFDLVHMVKFWAKKNHIVSCQENNHTFPSSYAWTLLCVYFFQVELGFVPSLLGDRVSAGFQWGVKVIF